MAGSKLDDKILRLSESIDREVERTLERHRARIASYDDVAFDERNMLITFRHGDEVVFNAVAEEIATLAQDHVFSWGWAERPGHVKRTRRVEVAKSLFAEVGVAQLSAGDLKLEDRASAEPLVRIVLHASRADGFYRVERGSRTLYFALFEATGPTAPANKVPSGKLVRRMTPSVGSVRAMVSSGPPPSSGSVPAARPLPREDENTSGSLVRAREPSSQTFMPVAQAAFVDIRAVLSGRIAQAVVILNVGRAEPKMVSVEVVAMDAEGRFRAVEASRQLRQVVSDMISVDASSGNGTWRRLVAYISMTDGPKLTFEVK